MKEPVRLYKMEDKENPFSILWKEYSFTIKFGTILFFMMLIFLLACFSLVPQTYGFL